MTDRGGSLLSPPNQDLGAVRSGFSAMAEEYDALSRTNPIVIWMRDRIRAMVERRLPAGGSILEINCGSGIDSTYFAVKGYRVHATDIAPGMLDSLASKAKRPEVEGRLTYENLSNTELDALPAEAYDLVFSNLGGLNCTEDLTAVTRHLPRLLKPGGVTVLVVMPPFCPWEMLQAFRGHLRTASRRLKRSGAEANVGGSKVRTWYHTPGRLEKTLGSGFETLALRSFSNLTPPSFFEGFTGRHPRMTEALMTLDDRLGAMWPLNNLGDFYALVSRRKHTAAD